MTAYDPAAVVIMAYNPDWARLFEAERAWLAHAWGDAIEDVHHVGSTSVQGLAAKPVIDILVLLERHPLPPDAIAAAEARGYEYRAEQGIGGREYFSIKAALGYHIHAFRSGHREALAMLRFRDHLRAHPATRVAYEALKRELAERYPRDREAYTNGKEAFVRKVLART